MSRIRNLSRGGWIVVGIVVALVLAPTAAYAFTYTGIIGSSGAKANESSSGQLLTAENLDVDSFTSLNGDSLPNANTSGTTCVAFGSMNLGAGQTAVMTNIQVDVGTADSNGGIQVFNDDSCSGSAVVNMRAPTLGITVIPLSTPVPLSGPDGFSEGGNGGYLFCRGLRKRRRQYHRQRIRNVGRALRSSRHSGGGGVHSEASPPPARYSVADCRERGRSAEDEHRQDAARSLSRPTD